MTRLQKAILCALALSASGASCASDALAAPSWFNRALVKVSHVRIADDIYATARLTEAERQRALADVQSARNRIAGVFGDPRARPMTIIAASDREAAQLGLLEGVPGAAFVTPVGTQVVLSMPNFSVDVAAHELMHAELVDRLGFWTWMTRLPVWFDEGVALQLDWRPGSVGDCAALDALRVRQVRALVRPWQFWDGGRDQVVANYRAARCAAAQVLARQPARSLYASIDRLRDGESFARVFDGGNEGAKGGRFLH